MSYKPISDYGVIGDMHSAALVARDGSIDWLCFPRFDSPSVFAALLDDRIGGRFQISPVGAFRSQQAYTPNSNILVTDFASEGAGIQLIDAMPPGEHLEASDHKVVRIARCDAGSMEMQLVFEPRLDYARGRTELRLEEGRAVASKGDDSLSLTASVPLSLEGEGAVARFRLSAGEEAAFVLTWNEPDPGRLDVNQALLELEDAEAFWRDITRDWSYEGRWKAEVRRSMLALHLLIYLPTGAVCAAATTSLPERAGGARNWDYRFAWLRDAAFTLDVFHRLGHTTYTRPFIQWMGNLALCQPGQDPHALFPISLGADPDMVDETFLDHLEGYKRSGPVRVGNAAYHQFQLDVYGEVMLAFDSFQRAGGVIDEPLWRLAQCLVEETVRNWQRPDNGIWEFRTEPRHFTYSKLMAWVAVDRGLRLARALHRPVDYDGWRRTRGLIRQDIMEHGWDPARDSFVQYYGGKSLDASLLFMPMVGFLEGDDPRMTATVQAIRRELAVDGMLYRYLPEEAHDGLPGEEGTFTMCSLWLAGALVAAGRLDEAQKLFEKVIGFANGLGLYSEMLDPRTGEYLGNYPQAFTHIALIHTARNLDRALRRRETGKVIAA